MSLTKAGLDKPGRTEYRRAARNAVNGTARGTLEGLDRSLSQLTQDVSAPRLLDDGGQEPKRASSAPGTSPMPEALRMFVIAL
jgi:hypothetical protein